MLEQQIATDLNAMYQEVTGQPGTLTAENLNGIVDVGAVLLSSNYREKYVNALFNVIGRYEFVDRPYEGSAPDIKREAWEWGSILSKSRTKDFDAVPNKTWDLIAGQPVDNQGQRQLLRPLLVKRLYKRGKQAVSVYELREVHIR